MMEKIDRQNAEIQQLNQDIKSERQERESLQDQLTHVERDNRFLIERLSQYQGRQHNDLMKSRQRALEKYRQEHIEANGESAFVPAPYADGSYDEIDYPRDCHVSGVIRDAVIKSAVFVRKDIAYLVLCSVIVN